MRSGDRELRLHGSVNFAYNNLFPVRHLISGW